MPTWPDQADLDGHPTSSTRLANTSALKRVDRSDGYPLWSAALRTSPCALSRRCYRRRPALEEWLHALARQCVGAFVHVVAGVPFHPAPVHVLAEDERIERLP